MATIPDQHDGLRLRMEAYRPFEYQSPHAHDTASITLILSGALEERSGGAVAHGNVFSVVVKPRNVIHEDRMGPVGARTLQLQLSPELVRVHAPDLQYQWLAGGEVARAMTGFLSEPHLHPVRIWGVFMDLLGALPTSMRARTDRVTGAQVRALADRIEENPASLVCVREVAEQLHLHPVSLARAFRRCHGCSITDYARRARIMRACRLMDGDSMPLAAVAAESGFADQAHFTRAFRRETGLSPGAFRKLARSAGRR